MSIQRFAYLLERFINHLQQSKHSNQINNNSIKQGKQRLSILDKWLQNKFDHFIDNYYSSSLNQIDQTSNNTKKQSKNDINFSKKQINNKLWELLIEQQKDQHDKSRKNASSNNAKMPQIDLPLIGQTFDKLRGQIQHLSNNNKSLEKQNQKKNKRSMILELKHNFSNNQIYQSIQQSQHNLQDKQSNIRSSHINNNMLFIYDQIHHQNSSNYQVNGIINLQQNHNSTPEQIQNLRIINPNIYIYQDLLKQLDNNSNQSQALFCTQPQRKTIKEDNKPQQDFINKQSQKSKPNNTIKLILSKLISSRPIMFILTTNNLNTLLSTISLLHFVYYVSNYHSPQNQAFVAQTSTKTQTNDQNLILNNNSSNCIKIITTKNIYYDYLQTFQFIKTMHRFLNSLEDQKYISFSSQEKQYSLIQSEQIKISLNNLQAKNYSFQRNFKEIQKKYMSFYSKEFVNISNKCHFILKQFHFYTVQPNQRFLYHQMELSLQNHNIFPYISYDLQIYNPLNSQLICLIEAELLKNIQNIYYSYKKGYYSEQIYLNVVKRLQQKQTLYKNKNLKIIFNRFSIQKFINSHTQIYQTLYLNFLSLTSISKKLHEINFSIKKTNFLTLSSSNANAQSKIDKIVKNSNLLFHDPHQLSVNKKIQIFTQIRLIQQLALLSDVDMFQVLNQSMIMQLNQNQVIHNSTSELQFVFIILDGVCLISNEKEQQTCKNLCLKNSLFGWKHFLILNSKQINYQGLKVDDQKNSNFQVYSPKAKLLRIQISLLQYLLRENLKNMVQLVQKNVGTQNQNSQFLEMVLFKNGININSGINMKIFNQKQSKQYQNLHFINKLLSVSQKKYFNMQKIRTYKFFLVSDFKRLLQSIPFKVFFANNPNLILLF